MLALAASTDGQCEGGGGLNIHIHVHVHVQLTGEFIEICDSTGVVLAAGATYLWAVVVEAYSALELACSFFLLILAWGCVCEPLAGVYFCKTKSSLPAVCARYIYIHTYIHTYIHE